VRSEERNQRPGFRLKIYASSLTPHPSPVGSEKWLSLVHFLRELPNIAIHPQGEISHTKKTKVENNILLYMIQYVERSGENLPLIVIRRF
jgi:hypothetical protein